MTNNQNTKTPQPGDTVIVETKPFIDSDRIDLKEVEIISIDRDFWHVKRNGSGHYCIRIYAILDFAIIDAD